MAIPKSTEMTIRHILLRELEKRRIKIGHEVTYSTPIGRLAPDVLLQNGGDYVIETKLGVEAKLIDAMIRLHDYSRYTGVVGAFAVLFPEELRRHWPIETLEQMATDPKLNYTITAIFKDHRPSQRFQGNLFEIADWIAEWSEPLLVDTQLSLCI